MRIVEKPAKSIITESKLPDADLTVNPYTGCEFACEYCYASFMGRMVGEPITEWGNYVFVKTNAVELFENELGRMRENVRQLSLFLSSVTDAWQGAEKKYRLARGIVRILAREQYPGVVSILTKSPLILDDLDSLVALPQADVGVTITTTDDAVSRILERKAPSATRRMKVLKALNEAGLPTYAFVGPLLPHFRFKPALLEELFKQIAETGTKEVYVEQINLSKYIRTRLDVAMEKHDPELARAYASASEDVHREALKTLVSKLVPKYGLRLRLGKVLDHKKDAKRASAGSAKA